MSLVLGLDISTTATKAILVDGDGVVRGIAQSAYDLSAPHPLWSEQDPGDWWTGTVAAVRTVLAETRTRAEEVEGIGLTGQMHGAILLDASNAVLRPAILWNDQRTAAECDEIRAAVGAQRLIQITGNDALTGFTAPKLLWVREHEPEVWSRIAHLLLPKDYVRLRLTGEHAIDKADAAGTLLLDLAARDWSAVVLEALDIPASWLPPTFEGPEITGRLIDAA
ncbi:MAG TPA: FGGY family carbohydrate kinase, partial [Candidatus Limnocylindria bacterium]|nr:FGGY family carbohydrate kinase [Candidatus Limnocylindria bacterium]